jgi:uncharacterized protein YhbP (UPF0306 family)
MRTPDLAPLRRLLSEESTLALATVGESGEPCIAPLFYLADAASLRVYWLSSAHCRHSRNLRARADAAVAVYHSTSAWREIRGAQLRGAVRIVRGEARRPIVERYAERFGLGPAFRLAIRRSSLYEFDPRWIRYLDNSIRFGHQFEVELGSPGKFL